MDPQRAEAYFKEAVAICQRDNGRLWDVSLCGPIVIADARTGTIATSQPPPDAARPRTLGLANAPVEWGGSRWVALGWDFTASLPDASSRGEVMLHELFHRIQPQLGLMTPAPYRTRISTPSRAECGCVSSGGRWCARSVTLVRPGRAQCVMHSSSVRPAAPSFVRPPRTERREEIREGIAHYTQRNAATRRRTARTTGCKGGSACAQSLRKFS